MLRGLIHFWRSHLAVAAGAAVATAVLTGALVVGDSMRESLRRLALDRLGGVEAALAGERLVGEDLAKRLAAQPGFGERFGPAAPVLALRGAAVHAGSGARASRVSVWGVDGRFAAVFGRVGRTGGGEEGSGESDLERDLERDLARRPGQIFPPVLLNAALARELGTAVGDEVLLSFPRPSEVPRDTVLASRDPADALDALRLTVAAVLADTGGGVGGFALTPNQGSTFNAFVALPVLQRTVGAEGRVDAVLVAGAGEAGGGTDGDAARLDDLLHRALDLDDLGLVLRPGPGWVTVESREMVLRPALAAAVEEVASGLGAETQPLLTYLANSLAVGGREVPYSTVTALATPVPPRFGTLTLNGGAPVPALADDEILLDAWAADELAARPGDRLTMTYYAVGGDDRLTTATAELRVAGVVAMSGLAADPGLTPDFPGIGDAEHIAAWKPPFPIDLGRIRPQDEAYWDRWRGTPKAFVSLATGRRLWASRFGALTAIRVGVSREADRATASPATAGPTGAPETRSAMAGPAQETSEMARTADSAQAGATREGAEGTEEGTAVVELERALAERLPAAVPPAAIGFAFQPVRARALAAASGATDFSGLFIGFSLFLIVAAALLVGLLFGLGVEQRAAEVGLRLAVGYPLKSVRRGLLAEGAVVAAVGALAGTGLAVVYAGLLLAALGSWWRPLVATPFLRVAVEPATLSLGFALSVGLVLATIALTLRRLRRVPAVALLRGETAEPEEEALPLAAPGDGTDRRGWWPRLTRRGGGRTPHRRRGVGAKRTLWSGAALAALLLTAAPVAGAGSSPELFFGVGAALLAAGCAGFALWCRRGGGSLVGSAGAGGTAPGWVVPRMAARNSARNPGRSLLSVVLVACAAFVLVSVAANRREVEPGDLGRDSGAGGFALVAESDVPIRQPLDRPSGLAELGILDERVEELAGSRIYPFRLLPGEDASCLNLYQPTRPRLLGAPPDFVRRGGFHFKSAAAPAGVAPPAAANSPNPWLLLDVDLGPGVVPAIGDENSVRWILHLGLGDDLVMTDDRGEPVRLRIVALLAHSLFQSELLISESAFRRHFPDHGGYRYFLIETPGEAGGGAGETAEPAESVARALESGLARWGFDATSTADRLAAYGAIENLYLTTFQSLGGLGLLLGTLGLGVVLVRNVLERRGELATLRAFGWRRSRLAAMVLAESAFLLLVGLAVGAVAGLAAVAPHLAGTGAPLPWGALGATFAAVLAAGLISCAVAVAAGLRVPLLPALKAE